MWLWEAAMSDWDGWDEVEGPATDEEIRKMRDQVRRCMADADVGPLLLRIEVVEDAAIRLMEAVLNEDKHKAQLRAADDLFRVLLRVKHGHGRAEVREGTDA